MQTRIPLPRAPRARAARRVRTVGPVAAALAAAVASVAVAHPDDPKLLDRVPPYLGPGWRAADAALGVAPPRAKVVTQDGAAVGFPSDGVQLLSWMPLSEFADNGMPANANDCWGYTSPSGREYALLGLENGTAFVEVTDPASPQKLAVYAGPSSLWRDVKVYEDHAYVVTEGTGAAIQVFDMSQIDAGVVQLVNTIGTGGGTDTHNVVIDVDSGYLYRTGGAGNGLLMYTLADKANPVLVGEWATRYVHDAQVVTYTSGPYTGRQIAYCCSGFNGGWVETGLTVLDVTNKANPQVLAQHFYPGGQYSHQAWLSEDRNYLYLNDELDENGVLPTTTFIIDVSDPANPSNVGSFTNGNTAVGHNLYVKGDRIYEANYRSGIRVFDASNPESPFEVAYFDTWPEDDNANFNGVWNVYPYFENGIVVGSDIEKGLFVWRIAEPVIAITWPDEIPDLVDPDGETRTVRLEPLVADAIVPGTAELVVDTGEDTLVVPLAPLGGDLYEAAFPAVECRGELFFHVRVDTIEGTRFSPPAGPGDPFRAIAATGTVVAFEDQGESSAGWSVENVALDDGAWSRGVPAGLGDRGDPTVDFDGSGACWLTDNVEGNSDVDGGPTRLTSPAIDVAGLADPQLVFGAWFTNDDADADRLDVEVSFDGGPWIAADSIADQAGWSERSVRLLDLGTPDASIRVRFSATDNPNDSVTEAGVDGIRVVEFECPDGVFGDLDGDGTVGFGDLVAMLSEWGPCGGPPCPADLDGDGEVAFPDLVALLAAWG